VEVINLLEITKSAVVFDENELIELERIILDSDKAEALRYLKKSVYEKILHSQQGKLKSHLDTNGDSIQSFKNNT
jgi:hypothetical protein